MPDNATGLSGKKEVSHKPDLPVMPPTPLSGWPWIFLQPPSCTHHATSRGAVSKA